MMKPLEQFICDHCGQLIEKPEHGYFEWLHSVTEGQKNGGFRIIHAAPHSPAYTGPATGSCSAYRHNSAHADLDLPRFLGPDGLVKLIGMIDHGPDIDPDGSRTLDIADAREFAEIFRRLQIPYYEEARLYWAAAQADGFFDGANEFWTYRPQTLKTLIESYGAPSDDV